MTALFARPGLASYNTSSDPITVVTAVLAVLGVCAAFAAYLAAVQGAVSLYLRLRPSRLHDEEWRRELRRKVLLRSLLVGLFCPLVWAPFLWPLMWLWSFLSSLL